MKITFLSPAPDISGGQRVVATYAKLLELRGHQVEIVCMRRQSPTITRLVKDALRGRLMRHFNSSEIPHFTTYGVNYRVLNHSGPFRETDLPCADVLIATWWRTAEAAANFTRSCGAKTYFIQGHEVYAHLPVERCKATYRMSFKKICAANWLAEVMRATYGDNDCVVVPNAVDTKQFFAEERTKNHCMTVGTMYSTHPNKGARLFAATIQIARGKLRDLEVIGFGRHLPLDQESMQAFSSYIASPAQDSLRRIYARCDAWLFGSKSEGFGLPILEAMACRTPVIGTPAGAAEELISHGGGILVPHDDPTSMADAILQIAQFSSVEWRAMSDAAFKTAASYSWENATDQFELALRALVDGRWNEHCSYLRAARQKTATPMPIS